MILEENETCSQTYLWRYVMGNKVSVFACKGRIKVFIEKIGDAITSYSQTQPFDFKVLLRLF